MTVIQNYQEEFSRLPKAATPWLGSVKQSAMERFLKNGFPTVRMEEWRDTNLSSITDKYFANSNSKDMSYETSLTFWKKFPHVVFYNGSLAEIVTDISEADIQPLNVALSSSSAIFQSVFNLQPKIPHAFFDLNTSMVQEGVGISIPKNTIVKDPIFLVYISDDEQFAHYYRNLVSAEINSQCQIIELYLSGTKKNSALTIPVTQFYLSQNSKVHHTKYQNQSDSSSHIGVTIGTLLNDSSLKTYSFSFGAGLTRNDIHITLDGQGSECFMDGLYVGSNKQTVDHHTIVDHAKPHCSSSETYKGILLDESHGIFEGKIKVDIEAQKTDAKQLNQNLLLSPNAHVNTAPQLEILADDVKCAHGATIGKLDENQIFYMRSRGIKFETARKMLIHSYAEEIISNIQVPELAVEVEKKLLEKIQS